ncbi:hypothetical protein C2845_PM01G22560 [Panicum miliaceum]|uniref:Uncharacterized protein n=1 Tax=Panicum miliaceum TaxID=4540 RepID=A0A3L6TKV4_PANMI|nr:hypothetical protein C2845_PM01G22560 [Panicum miliaceum]
MNLLFHLRYLGALALSGIIGLLLESWTLEQSNVYLWIIHQVKRGTSVVVPLNVVSVMIERGRTIVL